MSKAQHTQGTWIRDKFGNIKTAHGSDVLFRGVASICAGGDDRIKEAEANTDLIAQAPEIVAERDRLLKVNAELLEALEASICPLELYKAYGWPDRDRVISKAKAAIEKAKLSEIDKAK